MVFSDMTFFERKKELSKLSNRINYELDMNGGVADESIEVLMDTYRVKKILHDMYTDLNRIKSS